MFAAESEIKYLATKSSCLVTNPHHYQIVTAYVLKGYLSFRIFCNYLPVSLQALKLEENKLRENKLDYLTSR